MAIGGILILVVVAIGIITLRRIISNSDSPALKTAVGVGDFFIWLRFIGAIIFIALIMMIAR
jgi:hypothetical protein